MPAISLDQLKLTRTISRPGIFFALARVPETGRVYLGGSDFKVYETDLDQEKPDFRELGSHTSYVTGLALAGPAVVSGSYDGRLIWWDAEKRAPIRTVEAHAKWIRGVAATRDGKIVVSVADDIVARLWDAASGKLVHELRGHAEQTPHHYPSMLYAVAVSPDGRHVATGDKVGHVIVWDTATGKPVATVDAPEMYTWDPTARRHSIGGIRALAFAPDGSQLAVGGIGKIGNIDHLEGKPRVEVFDWRTGQRTHLFTGDGFKGLVEHLEFHPGGDWLLAVGGANDGFLMAFDLKASKVLRQEKAPAHLHAASLNEAGDRFYAAGHGKVLVYEAKG
jgi:WD40 repeat protein